MTTVTQPGDVNVSSVAELPEFKEALDKAVQNILETLKLTIPQQTSGINADGLAMAIAQLTDQGSHKRYVDPQVMRAREEAHKKMGELIRAARAEKRVATWQVISKTLLGNRVVEPFQAGLMQAAERTEIDWPGVPNEAMIPVNDTAKEIYIEYKKSIGSKTTAPDPKDDGYGVTAMGLVVRGAAVPRHNRVPMVQEGADNEVAKADVDAEAAGLVIHNKHDRRMEQKFILGSIAKPAMQSV